MLLLAASLNLFAFDRDRTIAHFLHTGWAVADGAPSGVHGIAQTTDGYLWLASTSGLIRFDGVRFDRYEPAQGGTVQFRDISALLATRDGGLWIGRTGGAIFLRNGRAVTYGRNEGLPLATVFRFALDRQGAVWAATSRGLVRFENSRWSVVGLERGFKAASATDLFLDSRENLWVTAPGALFCLPPHARSFRMLQTTNPWLMREAPDHTLWMSEYASGIYQMSGEAAEFDLPSKPTITLQGGPHEVLLDRDGGLWFTEDGIARIASPGELRGKSIDAASDLIQRFTQKDGLTADNVLAMFEDREGNIWVATAAGIDRFRRRNFVEGRFPLGSDYALALVTDEQGSILAGGGQSLMQFQNGKVSVRAKIKMPIGYQFPQTSIRCAYRDSEGAIWLGGHGMLAQVSGSRAENVELPKEVPPDGHWDVEALTRDAAGDLWVSIQQHGVFRRHDGVWSRYGKEAGLATRRTPVTLWTDDGGRVWLGFVGTEINRVDGKKTALYSIDGLHIGSVTFIGGLANQVWVAGALGFALFDGNRFHTIVGEEDADFRGISGIVETANGDFWLDQATGVAHIPAAQIAGRMRDIHHQLKYELFDFRDGVPGSPTPGESLPSAVLAADGRIWMSGSNGVYWVDPSRIYKNPLPPPVAVEAIYAGDKRYSPSETSHLPALPSNVRIEYTALSLSIPERVRFRYQLEGVDKGWQDAGTRRAAFYTRLPPGHFRFHVIACNNDGVWNQTGAVAAIVVPPAFFQTVWFRAFCACATLGVLWGLYLLRVRQISAAMRGRYEERVNERTRIARELHDTLLQSFQGLMLRFQVAHDELPARPVEARKTLEDALDEAAQAIAEGRDAVQGLRSSMVETNDLPGAIGSLCEELAGEESDSKGAESLVEVEGAPRDIHPMLRDEIFRIAGEALRNAFHHAQARRIKVAIGYGERQFRLRVRDDGTGIDPDVLDQRGRAGHWGLAGMRERAELVGGELEIWSRREFGTQVELSIPSSVAYTASSVRRFWPLSAKGGVKA